MQLNKIIETFYLSAVAYAGLELKDNVLVNKNDKLGDFTLDGRAITLPYFENLKRPEGKHIFHLLHESYVKPEIPLFNLYKKRLVCEINLKLVQLLTTITHISVSLELQGKIRDAKLLKFISEFKDLDMNFIENLMRIVKASKEVNDEAFILDLFLKKNGEIKGTPYSAIGKVNFLLYDEVVKTLRDSSEYRVYGCKVRKKDLVILDNFFNVIFPDIEDKDLYSDGTDNRVFRYLNILLKTAYLVTSRVNEIADMIYTIDDATIVTDLKFDHQWTTVLEELYTLTGEIRMIPNQNDTSVSETTVRRLSVDESAASSQMPDANQVLRQASQPMPMQQMQPQMQPMMGAPMQPMMTGPADPNDILRNITSARMNPNYNPNAGYHPSQMPPQPMQAPIPAWMREQLMREQGIPQQPQYPQGYNPQMMAPQGYNPQMMPQMPYPPQMMPQPYPQQMMAPPGYQPQYPQYQQPMSPLDPNRIGKQSFQF